MNWPGDEDISAMLALPEGYAGERLRRSEIPSLVASISVWHPDITVGAASCYKVLVPDEDLLRPGPRNLSPKAKALFEVLFPR